MKQGVWLRTVERIEEITIGTTHGAVECRTVNRLAVNERLDGTLVFGMNEVSWETVRGRTGTHIQVEVIEDVRVPQLDDEGRIIVDNDDEG